MKQWFVVVWGLVTLFQGIAASSKPQLIQGVAECLFEQSTLSVDLSNEEWLQRVVDDRDQMTWCVDFVLQSERIQLPGLPVTRVVVSSATLPTNKADCATRPVIPVFPTLQLCSIKTSNSEVCSSVHAPSVLSSMCAADQRLCRSLSDHMIECICRPTGPLDSVRV